MRTPGPALWLALAVPLSAFANGNVTTTQTEDTITIEGDASANEYEVKHGTDGQGNDVLVIEGKNGTTINGTPTFEIRLNAGVNRFADIDIQFSNGADKVTVDLSGLPADKRFHEVNVNAGIDGTTTIKNVQTDAGGKIEIDPGGTVSLGAATPRASRSRAAAAGP